MNLTDTHAHLNDEEFSSDRDELILKLKEKLKWIINVGYDKSSSLLAVLLSQKYDFLYAACGMHPHDSKDYDDTFESELEKMLEEKKVVAVGEIGLDYHYDLSERDIQREVFIKQLEIANKHSLPVCIHSRDASQDTYDILKKHLKCERGAVLHSFSQSREMLKLYLDMNVYFSLSGTITFKNAQKLRECVSYIPLDRMFIETDCPYLSPEPNRGKRNNPAYVEFTAKKIAEVKNIDYERLCDITSKNAESFFDI